ncbi:profilin [Nonomuraea sp. NPDC050643]|uniref:profilin n=1 Tax=Nonomuraea sp. NPDC050643 TaxID=3155660 RepID=UPI0034074925
MEEGSWQAYVEDNLLGSGKISKAAILGQQGSVWAASTGYTISPEEQQTVIDGYKRPEKLQASGLRLAGQKFFTLQVVERSVYLAKEADGAILVKTKQAILVAEYLAPVKRPDAVSVVEGLADHLISIGY